MPAIIDTSAVLAAFDRRDPAHGRVTAAVARERATIVIPTATLPEIAFLLGRRHGAVAAAQAIANLADGPWPLETETVEDVRRAATLMLEYADARIGFVDAAIVAVAERLGATRIYTLDRRDFSIIRPRHASGFVVLPD